ncbi:MAG: FAD-binding oxidoreductase [Candidatus Bathyarchaeota archaeon]|nr:FAD-binding oxidoreductase [Candidatus Bathyarchaeota archaeon]MDH5746152.1 FAD-binding oxidoreductase [Candidatus Bathyarchaeota archaeon]
MKDAVSRNPRDIVRLLTEIVGKDNVLYEQYDLIPYSRDRCPFLTHPKHGVIPLAVVRPATTEEVQEIVVLANKHHIPLTPRGSGTNYAGSAVPSKGGVVVDLTRMNRILAIDEESMSAKVQPGLILQDFEEALSKRGFTFGHDPGSFPSATVGGCISTWSVGWRAGKYGDMGRLVLSLKVVLPTGIVIETRSVPKSSTGFDVKSLFIGAEGAMGMITEAVLRIHPSPEKRVILVYGFKDFEQAFKSLLKVLRAGLCPMMQLVTNKEGMEGLVEKSRANGFVMISYEGVKEVVDAQAKRTASILEAEGGMKISDEVAEQYWADRHDMFSKMNLVGAAGSIDTAVPVSKVLEFYKFLEDWAKRRGVKVFDIASWVLPENLGMDSAFDESEVKAYIAARDEALRKALELGGTTSYCVGVGTRFPHLMREEHGPALDVLRAIKRTLDPNNIMNPGWLSP